MTHVRELRELVWALVIGVERIKAHPMSEQTKHVADVATEHLKEAHLALFLLQLDIDREQGETARRVREEMGI